MQSLISESEIYFIQQNLQVFVLCLFWIDSKIGINAVFDTGYVQTGQG